MKFLATVDENFEIEMLRELLESKGIPVATRHRETGEFMMISTGISIYGADLYVDEDQHETALEVYNAYFAGKAEIDEADLIQEALNAENPEELDPDEVDMLDDTEDEVPEDEV